MAWKQSVGLNMATIKKAVEAFIKKIKAGTDHPKNKKEKPDDLKDVREHSASQYENNVWSIHLIAARFEATLPEGMFVASGYGAKGIKDKSKPVWRLYVCTDNKDTKMVPKEFEGYPVSIRPVARAY